MWVRGLKQRTLCIFIPFNRSHPMWVRGLKHELAIACRLSLNVAPHVGAWIETLSEETGSKIAGVAPHVGAWIETKNLQITFQMCMSHPMWVRGMKLVVCHLVAQALNVAPHVGAWIETGMSKM